MAATVQLTGAGMNYAASPLTTAEIKRMVAGPSETRNRVLTSFRLMLDFYGTGFASELGGQGVTPAQACRLRTRRPDGWSARPAFASATTT